MNILVVFATSAEAEILDRLRNLRKGTEGSYSGRHNLSVLVTGIGGISTAWSMKQWLSVNPKPDMALNAGIAGSFSKNYGIGEVVIPVLDCFADLGIEIDGKFQTLGEAGMVNQDETPFEQGLLVMNNNFLEKVSLLARKVKAVTVNTATGAPSSIERLLNKFRPDIETMEGATFFYICIREKIPFLAIRAISNFVEPGKRGRWEIPVALDSLAEKVDEILNIL